MSSCRSWCGTVWHLAGDRERASKVVQRGLASFDFLPATDANALRAELGRARDTQSGIGPKYGLRNGVYRSFANGWTWTKPPAIWRISVGDDARAVNAASELYLVEPDRGLYGLAISETTTASPEDFHLAVVGNFTDARVKPEALQIGKIAAHVSMVDSEQDGVALRFKIATVRDGDRGVQLTFWGHPATWSSTSRQSMPRCRASSSTARR